MTNPHTAGLFNHKTMYQAHNDCLFKPRYSISITIFSLQVIFRKTFVQAKFTALLVAACFAINIRAQPAKENTFPIVIKNARAVVLYSKEGPKLNSIAATLWAEDIEE